MVYFIQLPKKKKKKGSPYGTFNVLGGMIFFMKSLRNVK